MSQSLAVIQGRGRVNPGVNLRKTGPIERSPKRMMPALGPIFPERQRCWPGRSQVNTFRQTSFVVKRGFHRIRHYGLLARSRTKADTLARARELIAAATPATAAPMKTAPRQQQESDAAAEPAGEKPDHPCPHCGCRMTIIETFDAGQTPRHRPRGGVGAPAILIGIDTS